MKIFNLGSNKNDSTKASEQNTSVYLTREDLQEIYERFEYIIEEKIVS